MIWPWILAYALLSAACLPLAVVVMHPLSRSRTRLDAEGLQRADRAERDWTGGISFEEAAQNIATYAAHMTAHQHGYPTTPQKEQNR